MTATPASPKGDFDVERFIIGKIQNLRTKLLDLTARNPLLSFKHGARGQRFLRVIDELPELVYGRLNDGDAMRFKPLPDPDTEPDDEKTIDFKRALEAARYVDADYLKARQELGDESSERQVDALDRELRDRVRKSLGMPAVSRRSRVTEADAAQKLGLNPNVDLPVSTSGGTSKHHSDNVIQVLMFKERMNSTLAKIRENARLSLEESGVNTFHVAIGFLEWYEDPNSNVALFAPLLLLPLNLDREVVRGEYCFTVQTAGDGAELNVTLAERLKRDFAIKLPAFDEEVGIEAFFQQVADTIRTQSNWKVRRWVTFGLFSFSRIAMYKDLDPELWGGSGPLESRRLIQRVLAGVGKGSSKLTYAPDRETDGSIDHMRNPALIADADNSQVSAILDVLDGKDTVIEGPPGTGKSQTITNIIASALAQKKRVLFVAEKMAALNVVKSRLDAAGLGTFCLEMHSTKGGRKEVVEALARRRAVGSERFDSEPLDDALARCEDARARLSCYAARLNEQAGSLGLSVHELVWAFDQAKDKSRDFPSDFDELRLPGAEFIKKGVRTQLIERCQSLGKLRNARAQAIGVASRHPWAGIASAKLSALQSADVVRHLAKLLSHLKAGIESLEQIGQWGGKRPTSTVTGLVGLAEKLKKITPPGPHAEQSMLTALASAEIRQSAIQFLQEVDQYQKLVQELRPRIGALPQKAEVVSRMQQAFGLAESLGQSHRTLNDIPGELAQTKLQAARAQSVLEALDAFQSRLGLQGPLSSVKCRQLAAIAATIAGASDRVCVTRKASLLGDEATEAMRRAKVSADQILLLKKRLEPMVRIDSQGDVALLEGHAVTIGHSGLVARLLPEYRKSVAYYRSICRPGPKPTRENMAQVLSDLAQYRRLLGEFCAHRQLREILGHEITDRDLELGDLTDAAAWIDSLKLAIPLSNDADRELRKRIVEAPSDEFALLRAAAQRVLGAALDNPLYQAMGESLKAHVDQLHQRVSGLAALAESGTSLREIGSLVLNELQPLAVKIASSLALEARIDENRICQQLLGERFRGVRSDLKALHASTVFAHKADVAAGNLGLIGWLCEQDTPARVRAAHEAADRLTEVFLSITQSFDQASAVAPIDLPRWVGHKSIDDLDVDQWTTHIDRCLANTESLHAFTDELRQEAALREAGFGVLIDWFERRGISNQLLHVGVERLILASALRSVLEQDPVLAHFSGLTHDGVRAEFKRLDIKLKELRQKHIAHDLTSRHVDEGESVGPRSQWTNLALIDNECAKSRRHVPLRDLLDRAGSAMQQLMPCFMMSPLSVAQNLKPGGLKFDIVVMDEASQMRPEEALGAIARADQVVVVGDPKQLPPTAFFYRSETEDLEDDEFADSNDESILDSAAAVITPLRRLRWHYRSRHGSLIAYSNHEFYDNDLIVFPSPFHQADHFGVRLERVSDGVYGKGVNLPEARHVALAALNYMQKHPDRSLGLVTLNQKQQALLTEEMDRLFIEHPHAEEYRLRWESENGGLEPFFIKNLENVQGDERDAIFISTVYGRDEEGNVFQRFGPINGAGGHRRLNVLFTRAKYQVVVFSSMDAGDIRVDEGSSRGVRALKGFLQYAASGRVTVDAPTGREPDSDFEIAVASKLREAGYLVDPQVGVCGYFIDLAVRHPKKPGEYILGIECDGAQYHSARSARDRDRLRQEVLERLGWNIHRVWSLDWFRDPRREASRIAASVTAVLTAEG